MLATDDLSVPTHQLPGGRPTTADLYGMLVRLDAKVDKLDVKVDRALEFRTQFFAVMSVVKWIGLPGVIAAAAGVLVFLPK